MKLLSLPIDNGGCGNYRIRQPFKGLEKLLPVKPHIMKVEGTEEDFYMELVQLSQLSDILFVRPGIEIMAKEVKEIFKKAGKTLRWVIDVDDDMETISPLSQFYSSYGQEEYEQDGIKVWEDGRSGFNLENNKKRKQFLEDGFRKCNAIIASTPVLAEKMKKYNNNVIVNYNSIDFENYPNVVSKSNNPLRILWHGSPSHFEDFLPIREGINHILRRNKVELYMVGSSYNGIFDNDVRHKIKVLPFVPFAAHSYRLLCFQADIALIPLADNKFNRSKSSIKWYEMSACKLPSVVSNVTPYREDVQDNKTAYDYNSESDFVQKMQYLIDNPHERKRIAKQAYKWVYNNRNLVEQSKKFYEDLKCLIS